MLPWQTMRMLRKKDEDLRLASQLGSMLLERNDEAAATVHRLEEAHEVSAASFSLGGLGHVRPFRRWRLSWSA